MFALGELTKAADILQLFMQTFPRNVVARIYRGGMHRNTGEFEASVHDLEEAVRLTPRNPIAYGNLRDLATAKQGIEWLTANGAEMIALDEQALNAVVLGQRRSAAELFQRGADVRRRRNLPDGASVRTQAAAGEHYAPCASVFINITGTRLVPCGNVAAALSTAEAEALERPDDTLLKDVRLPILRATIALDHKQPDKAIELLQSVAPYERAYTQAIYLRGLAYLQLRKGAEAATEFQKIVDHKGAHFNSRYPLAVVGLARAAVLTGDTNRARKAYEDFLSLWKDADPDIPILIEAKNEYAGLN